MNSPEQSGPEDLRDHESVHGAESIDDLYIAGPREAIKEVQNSEYPGSGEAGGGAYRYESEEQDAQPEDEEPSWKEKFNKHGGTRGWERTQRAVEQVNQNSTEPEESPEDDDSTQSQPVAPVVRPEPNQEPEPSEQDPNEETPEEDDSREEEPEVSPQLEEARRSMLERAGFKLGEWYESIREKYNQHKRKIGAGVLVALVAAGTLGIANNIEDNPDKAFGEPVEDGPDDNEIDDIMEPFIDTVGEGEGITHTIRDYIAEKHQVSLSADQYSQIWDGLTEQFSMDEIKAGFSGVEDMEVYGGAGFPEAGEQTEMSPDMQRAVEDILEEMGWK